MKKKSILLLVLATIIGFLLPKDVFAVGTTLKFKTTVNGWKSGTDLAYYCGNSSTNTSSTVYIGPSVNNLTQTTCSFDFDSLSFNPGDTFVIVEEFDFSSYSGTNPEYQNITISPGLVYSPTISYDADEGMFGEYDTTSPKDAVLYNMNPVDDDNNITGNLYVYDAYFDENDEKVTEKDLGSVNIPSYCVKYHFSVKGNIANAYGNFMISEFRTDDFVISGTNGHTTTVCDINGVDLNREQYITLINSDITYENVDRSLDYSIDSSPDEEVIDQDGIRTTDVYVTATLESDGSQTGLLYTVIPFVILIGLVVLGYFIIKENKVKDDEII